LEAWRRRAARDAGVPEYVILGNAALDTLAAAAPPSLAGLGPRARAKYGDELLRIVAAHRSDHYFPRVDQGGACPGHERRVGDRRVPGGASCFATNLDRRSGTDRRHNGHRR
jgi:hypothetical protein